MEFCPKQDKKQAFRTGCIATQPRHSVIPAGSVCFAKSLSNELSLWLVLEDADCCHQRLGWLALAYIYTHTREGEGGGREGREEGEEREGVKGGRRRRKRGKEEEKRENP